MGPFGRANGGFSVPVNVSFQIDDFEEAWTYSQPFDYIHSRMMNTSVSNWTEYLRKSFEYATIPRHITVPSPAPPFTYQTPLTLPRNLNPGGYLELQEFALPLSDDGTLMPEHALWKSMDLLSDAAAKLNHAFIDLNKLKGMMIAAGFVDVEEIHYKWPSNTWPKDKWYKELGAWNNKNITSGLQGFLMAALTRGLGWAREEVDVLAAQVRKDVNDRNIHAYWPM